MDKKLNGSGKDNWNAMERTLRATLEVDPDADIRMIIDVGYPGDLRGRPDLFTVEYTVDDGDPTRETFRQ
jgi:hypothetical protein